MLKSFCKVFLLAVLVAGLASPALATTARVNSLAQAGDYLNDDSNVFRWYGTLPSYSDLVMMEVGTWDGEVFDQAIGVANACGEDGKWGTWALFLLRDHMADNSFYVNTPIYFGALAYDSQVELPVNKLAIAWGKEFDGFALGVNFTRSDQSYEDETIIPTVKVERSFTTIGAGVRADIGEEAYTDLAATVGIGGYNVEGAAPNELDKKTAIDIAGRIFYEWKDNVTLVPVVDYFQSEFALKTDTEPFGDKMRGFFAGIGMNVDVNTNNLLLVGAQLEYFKWEWSSPGTAPDEYTLWNLPRFFLALESSVKPWLTARVGAWKALEKETDTVPSEDPTVGADIKTTDADFQWFLGLGFHVAEFDIDMELGEDTPFNVGYWLTGYENWDTAPVTRMSATYHF